VRECVWADTGPADTDSDPSTASTFGPTNILGGGDVAADGAVSLGSTSLSGTSLRARERVWIRHSRQIRIKVYSSLNIYLFITPNKMAAKLKVNYS